jgi:predicted dehydrogenase
MPRSLLFPIDYQPKPPKNPNLGIGVIGAGQIVNQAHLPAYRKAGLQVLAIADTNLQAAQETAKRFDIPQVCSTVGDLLQINEVSIVDIAVPAVHNPALAKQALEAGKHVLVQKPMAETVELAEAMMADAATANRKLAVNQQMRWSPSVRAATDLLRRGLLGELLECSIHVEICTPWESWPWLRDHPYPEIYYHTIHYVDTIRSWLGEPLKVYSSLARYPGAFYQGPTRNYTIFEFPGNLRATIFVNHHTALPPDRWKAEFHIEGTEGTCSGLIGLLLNYPVGRSDVFRFSHPESLPKGSIELELEGRWFPDAFIGPMSSLLDAVSNDSEPETSARDVIRTLRVLDAIRISAETGQAVSIS